MRKQLDAQPGLFPMPVTVVAAYDENGTIQLMNAAWAQISSMQEIALFIDEDHATTKAIRQTGAFTVSLADVAHMKEADYVGIASGNKVHDKFARTGLTATKAAHVNAPVIEEFPVCLECELVGVTEGLVHAVIGKIVGVSADEGVLDDEGRVDPAKLDALVFDQFQSGYYAVGTKVGQAWSAGAELL